MTRGLPFLVALAACGEPPPPCSVHEDCSDTQFCVEESFCLEVFDREYAVTITAASVPATGPTGGAWDPEDGSGPDLIALFGSPTEGGDVCSTSVAEDTTSATWNETCELSIRSGDGFAIEVSDLDIDNQATFIGGWLWEDDAAVVTLIRNFGEDLVLEQGSFSTEFRIDPP